MNSPGAWGSQQADAWHIDFARAAERARPKETREGTTSAAVKADGSALRTRIAENGRSRCSNSRGYSDR
jgi:hypothetical protein